MIEAGKQEEFAGAAVNPKWLPRMLRSSPFVESIGRNHTTPVGERLGESCPALYCFGFGVDRIDGAAVLAPVRREPPFGGRKPAILVFGRDDKMFLLGRDIVARPIMGERGGRDAKSGGEKIAVIFLST